VINQDIRCFNSNINFNMKNGIMIEEDSVFEIFWIQRYFCYDF